jgi:hypothetical protein
MADRAGLYKLSARPSGGPTMMDPAVFSLQ